VRPGSAFKGNLAVLLAAIFLIACAEELWGRFIPNYIRALGGSVLAVGAYGTLKDFLDAVYQFPGGLATARLGYRNSLVLFNALALAGYLCFALARQWWVLLLALPLVMAWQSFSLPATFSLIGDSLPQGARSVAFAYQSIVRRIPIVVAPIVGGAIITAYGVLHGTRIALYIGVGIGAVALVVQLARYAPHAVKPVALGLLVRDVTRLHPRLKRLLLSDIIVRFGQGTAEIFVVLYVVQVLGFTSAAFGVYVGIAMATSLLVYVPFARLADARGREGLVTLTYVFFALFPLSLVFAHNVWMLGAAFVLMGLREIGEPPRKAMIVDLAREDRRSVDVGSYYLARGLAVFPASLFGGLLWRAGPQYTFAAAAAIAALGATVFFVAVARVR
jgi:MFS family permease